MRRRRPHRRHRFRRFRAILRPFAGRKLPPELRVGQVGRLAAALDGPDDPRFETLLRRIESSPILGGNTARVFFSGKEAFTAMGEAVSAARREILLESYIFRDDATGRGFAEQLAAAAARGVAVRILTDAVGSFGTRREFWARLRDGGVEVRLFHPILSDFFDQLVRDHRKIFVVDRAVAFTGGMNIGEEYGSLVRRRRHARPLDTWRDTHVRVEGPAAWDLATVFCEGWARSGGDLLDLEPLPASAAEAPGARILVLDTRPGRGQAEAASAFAAIVGAARRSAYLTNAYFAPGPTAGRILGEAAARGVDVRVLLPGRTDVSLVRHAGHGYFADLLALRPGLRVREGHPSRQDPGRRRPGLGRRLDQPRLSFLRLQRRVQPGDPRSGHRRGHGTGLSPRSHQLDRDPDRRLARPVPPPPPGRPPRPAPLPPPLGPAASPSNFIPSPKLLIWKEISAAAQLREIFLGFFVTLEGGGAPHSIEGNGDLTVSAAMTLSRLGYQSPPVLKPFLVSGPSLAFSPSANVSRRGRPSFMLRFIYGVPGASPLRPPGRSRSLGRLGTLRLPGGGDRDPARAGRPAGPPGGGFGGELDRRRGRRNRHQEGRPD